MILLGRCGPTLQRPYVDSVKGSRAKNMKELRVQSQGRPIRAFFVFDEKREALMLCGGDKSRDPKRFYTRMISIADAELDRHLRT